MAKIKLIIFVESALGLLNLREILEAGIDQTNLFKLDAVVFGSDDFFANIGGFDMIFVVIYCLHRHIYLKIIFIEDVPLQSDFLNYQYIPHQFG